MGKKFENRKKVRSGQNPLTSMDRQNEKPFEVISGGHRGAQKYSRQWNSGYNGPGKGTN